MTYIWSIAAQNASTSVFMFKLLPHLPSSPALAAQSVCDCGCRLNPGALKRKDSRNNAPSCFVHPSTSQILKSWEASSNSSTCACTWAGCDHPTGSFTGMVLLGQKVVITVDEPTVHSYHALRILFLYDQFTYNCHGHGHDSKTWMIWYAISTQLHQAFEQQTSHLDRIRKAMRVQRVTSGIKRTLRIYGRFRAMVYETATQYPYLREFVFERW